MLDELQNWWQQVTPEMREAGQRGSLVLAALIGGYFLGSMVAHWLRAKNFDAALRLPGSPTPATDPSRCFSATTVAGLLVRLTVWAGAAWWLARDYGKPEVASALALIINRAWALATVLVAALSLGSLLAGRVIDCLKIGSEGLASRNGTAASPRNLAGVVAAAVYGLTVLLALLMAADFFNWPLTRSAADALWQLARHLLVAGAALFMGHLGAGWARDLVMLDAATTPEKRMGLFTGLGIVAVTTMLAVAVLLTSIGVLLGLAVLAILATMLWFVRHDLPDISAGLQLRANKVHEVWFEGAPWQVAKVGLVSTEVTRAGAFHRVQNRVVLEARMHAAPVDAGRG
ncbi:MAG TPA: hypothetical protein VKU02_10470 [Gemmataceae bacterium]|nr:hypothetical protein [Gemmataceae bacterium]